MQLVFSNFQPPTTTTHPMDIRTLQGNKEEAKVLRPTKRTLPALTWENTGEQRQAMGIKTVSDEKPLWARGKGDDKPSQAWGAERWKPHRIGLEALSDEQPMSNGNPLGLKQAMTSPRWLDTNSDDTKETLPCTYLRHKHRLNTYLHLPEKTQAEHRQAKGTKTVSNDKPLWAWGKGNDNPSKAWGEERWKSHRNELEEMSDDRPSRAQSGKA